MAEKKLTKLQRILKKRGVSVTDLMHMILQKTGHRVSYGTLRNIANGTANPQLDTLIDIAKTLEINVGDFAD